MPILPLPSQKWLIVILDLIDFRIISVDADSTVEEACDVSWTVFWGQIGSSTLIRSCRNYSQKMRLALPLEVNRATTMHQTGPHTRVYSMCVYFYVWIMLRQNSD